MRRARPDLADTTPDFHYSNFFSARIIGAIIVNESDACL